MGRVNYKIGGYEGAERIVERGFDGNKTYLLSLIGRVCGGEYADSIRDNYSKLYEEGKKIHGLAKKILNSKPVEVREEPVRVEDSKGHRQLDFFD